MAIRESFFKHPLTKIGVVLLASIPMLVLGVRVALELSVPGTVFGADPGKEVVDFLGEWSLNLLFVTLTVSSLARLAGTPELIRYRRTLGLAAFTYVICHFLSYFAFLVNFDILELFRSVYKRPYIVAGMVALVTLIPLAITSTDGWRRRLRRNWSRLHKLVYVTAIAGWIHLFWQEKGAYEESAIYGIILLLLFAERIAHTIKRRKRRLKSEAVV